MNFKAREGSRVIIMEQTMVKKSLILLAVAMLAGAVLGAGGVAILKSRSDDGLGEWKSSGEKLTVIVTNNSGQDDQGVWQGEAGPFLNRLENRQEVSESIGMCEAGYEGQLFGQKVLVVVTGMAKVKTSACITNVLEAYGDAVKEVVLAGIAGFTPMKGGLVDDSGKLRSDERVMLGDVCINSAAFDFDLQHYSADEANSGYPRPVFWPQESEFWAEKAYGSAELAGELHTAAGKVDWPEIPESVRAIDELYHGTSRGVKVWSASECVEASGDLFWHDIRADRRARKLGANFLSDVTGKTVKADGVVVASSMEGTAVGAMVDRWNSTKGANVAFAYVRGASNFDQVNLNAEGLPAVNGDASVHRVMAAGGQKLAIETAALPVLKMLELRGAKLP
jgi:nucleoside phosphorylase